MGFASIIRANSTEPDWSDRTSAEWAINEKWQGNNEKWNFNKPFLETEADRSGRDFRACIIRMHDRRKSSRIPSLNGIYI